MPRRNRVDPFGDLHAVEPRGMFTGNRGCLVNENAEVVRHHRGSLWISCLLAYKDWRSPLSAPRHWTPLFFLDDAVALAAGHRPCGLCRPDSYRSYKNAVSASRTTDGPIGAGDLNRFLAAERLRNGRGLDRANDRRLWTAPLHELPIGTMIVDPDGQALVLLDDRLMEFSFSGWTSPQRLPDTEVVRVLTPPTSVAALQHGFVPSLHKSASKD